MGGTLKLAICVFASVLFCAFASAQSNQSPPQANPGRPTVSTPATLTPVGYLQFETGGLGASDSPGVSTFEGINEVTKLTVAPRLQFLAAVSPFAHYSIDDRKIGRASCRERV